MDYAESTVLMQMKVNETRWATFASLAISLYAKESMSTMYLFGHAFSDGPVPCMLENDGKYLQAVQYYEFHLKLSCSGDNTALKSFKSSIFLRFICFISRAEA